MQRNFDRILKVMSGGKTVFDGNRIRIQGRGNMTLLPDFYLVEVYNVTGIDMAIIQQAGELKILSDDGAILCSGTIEDIYQRNVDANVISVISLVDGQRFWDSKVSVSFGAGGYVKDIIRQILSGALMGSFLADDMKVLRPVAFSGRLADSVSALARTVNARAFIAHDVLHVVTKGRTETVTDVQESDVLESPNSTTGIYVLKTNVKSWHVGMLHRYRGKMYRLAAQTINADNFEGKWETDLILVDESYLDDDGMEGG